LAGVIAGRVGGQKDRQRCDFLGPLEAALGWRSVKDCATSEFGFPVFVDTSLMRSPSEGDSMVPGQIAFTRMPRLMKSAATCLFRPITAARAAPYT